MLIDFSWEDISAISNNIKLLNAPVSLFLYGSNDDDAEWCINQAKQCNSVLLNMRHRDRCELIKGYLLGEPNVYYLGYHPLEKLFQRNIIDTASWLALQYQYYLEANNVETKHR